MGTEMQVPAHIAARIAARGEGQHPRSAIFDAIVGDFQTPPRISIRAGRYRLVDQGVETPVGIELDVVIIGANPGTSKAYFEGEYDPNAVEQMPVCFSYDGITPHERSTNIQNDSCLTCPHNVLGSKINPSGAKSKRCTDRRYLAVVAASDPSKVYQLQVPVGSMKAMREYIKRLGNYGVMPEEVITTLGFDEEASAPRITFTQRTFLSEKALAMVESIMDGDEVKAALHTNDAAKSLPAPAATNRIAATETKEAPLEGTDDGAAEAKKKAADEEAAKKKAAADAAAKKKAAAEKKAAEEKAAAEKKAAEENAATEATADAPAEGDVDDEVSEIEKALGDIFG